MVKKVDTERLMNLFRAKYTNDSLAVSKMSKDISVLEESKNLLTLRFQPPFNTPERLRIEAQVRSSEIWLHHKIVATNMEIFVAKSKHEIAMQQLRKSYGKYEALKGIFAYF